MIVVCGILFLVNETLRDLIPDNGILFRKVGSYSSKVGSHYSTVGSYSCNVGSYSVKVGSYSFIIGSCSCPCGSNSCSFGFYSYASGSYSLKVKTYIVSIAMVVKNNCWEDGVRTGGDKILKITGIRSGYYSVSFRYDMKKSLSRINAWNVRYNGASCKT